MDRAGEISQVLAALDDAELIEGFLRSILTDAEVETISSRWELVKMLVAGVSQRTIARELGLSLCKITRGSRELKETPSALARVIDSLHELTSNQEKEQPDDIQGSSD